MQNKMLKIRVKVQVIRNQGNMSTGSELFALLGSGFAKILGQIIFKRVKALRNTNTGADLGGGCPPHPRDDLRFSNTTGILQKNTMWFIGVEVEQETSTPPPKKNPGSAPAIVTPAHQQIKSTTFQVLFSCITEKLTGPKLSTNSRNKTQVIGHRSQVR